MAIGQVAVSHKTKNGRMPLKPLKTRAIRHTPDETPPYFGGINCIKDNVEIEIILAYLIQRAGIIKKCAFAV